MDIIFAQSLWLVDHLLACRTIIKQDALKTGKTYEGGLLITNLSLQDMAYYVMLSEKHAMKCFVLNIPGRPCSIRLKNPGRMYSFSIFLATRKK